jgi:hypothetical protein
MQPAAANPILTIPDGTVFSKGDELYDKRFRERYVVLETARASGGELVSWPLSSWLKCGTLWNGTNWTSQAGVGIE